MRNPYEVLEIHEGASKDEIKKAYKELAKKYHPDQYGSNPLKDLAEEKMREVNEAYDYLMKNDNDGYNSFSGQTGGNAANALYQEIRRDLQNGNLGAAEEKLNRINVRDAEWNFLIGTLYLRKGWYDNAYTHISTACRLNPYNTEYREAFNMLNNRNTAFRQPYRSRNGRDSDMCDMCVTLWCCDSLCECAGGDLISCC